MNWILFIVAPPTSSSYLNGYLIPGEHLVLCNLRLLPGGAFSSLWEASTDFEVCKADDKYVNVSGGDSTEQIALWGESATHRLIYGEKEVGGGKEDGRRASRKRHAADKMLQG